MIKRFWSISMGNEIEMLGEHYRSKFQIDMNFMFSCLKDVLKSKIIFSLILLNDIRK